MLVVFARALVVLAQLHACLLFMMTRHQCQRAFIAAVPRLLFPDSVKTIYISLFKLLSA